MTEKFNLHFYRQQSQLLRLLIFAVIIIVAMVILLIISAVILVNNMQNYDQQKYRINYLSQYYHNLPDLNYKLQLIDQSIAWLNHMTKKSHFVPDILNAIGAIDQPIVIINKIQLHQNQIIIEGDETFITGSTNFILELAKNKYFKEPVLTSLEKSHFVINSNLVN
jgi:hypothetical protein